MIDIHSHLIYNVDDGSKSIEDSIDIIESLNSIGITDIILTPHYIVDTNYVSSKLDNIKKLKVLQSILEDRNIDTRLYLGNEIYIDRNIIDYLCKNEMCSLNNTEYLLVELPMSGNYTDYQDIFSSLISEGCKVILAHPERYISFQKDYSKIDELRDLGVLFQCNVDSILGAYGNNAKKVMKYMLKNKLVSFVGTDIHRKKDNYNYIDKAKAKYKKYLSDEEIDNIFNKNALSIIKRAE